jgi:copper chaperone CopZ
MDALRLQVQGMDCGGCEESIRKAVSQVEGVASVTADHVSGLVEVSFARQPDEEKVRTAIEEAGYEVVGGARA